MERFLLLVVTLAMACSYEPPNAAVPGDVSPGGDTSQDGGCVGIVEGAGMLVAPAVTSLAVDGDLSDWPTCFLTLDAASAAQQRLPGPPVAATFSVARVADELFVAVQLEGIAPLGDHPNEFYRNESVAVYVDADDVRVPGTYGGDAGQIVIDHANRTEMYRATQKTPFGTPPRSAVVTNGLTSVFEVAISASTLGAPAFASTIGFDLGINNGDGADHLSELIWFKACECACNNSDSAPYCNAEQFGRLRLQ